MNYMKCIFAIITVVLLVLSVSCDMFDPPATIYSLYIRNYTSDSLRIVVKGGSIGLFEEYLDTSIIGYDCTLYQKEIESYPEPAFTSSEFDALFDSISVYCKHNDSWHKTSIEGINSMSGWDMYSKIDYYYEHTYRFFFYDSLLNLEE